MGWPLSNQSPSIVSATTCKGDLGSTTWLLGFGLELVGWLLGITAKPIMNVRTTSRTSISGISPLIDAPIDKF
jgi:hypothetical protein